MKLAALPIVVTAALATSLLAAAPTVAKPADCLFVFQGESYIDGACELKTADSGSFQVEADGYLVQLDVEGDGLATGSWNGDVRASQLQQPLHGEGELKQDGTCWTSKAVKLCVWQPGERQEPKPVKLPHLEAREYGAGAESKVGSWSLVAVASNGKLDRCYGSVPGDSELQGPLKLTLDAGGKWALSAPSAGTAAGYKSTFDIEYHEVSGSIDGQVDGSGQRMNLVVTNEVLKGLVSAASVSLGYAPDLVYRLRKTGLAIKALQACRAEYSKKW
jgi:hypothetical protein